MDFKGYSQIKLPSPTDMDPHPRLLLDGWGLHAGETVLALLPDGKVHGLTLEVSWEQEGPACWYISTPGYGDICPVGLWVKD